jgi:uncharacterized Zn-finger protein
MNLICEFCNSEFSRKSNLINHQKTAKFCLGIQGKENKNFTCIYCDKNLTTNSALTLHKQTCKNKSENNPKELMSENKKLKDSIDEMVKDTEQKLILKNSEIENYKENIKKLENKIEKLENVIIGIAESKNEIIDESIDKQIEMLSNKYGKKQRRQQIQEPNVIYILTTELLKKQRRYIFGKSKNLTSRLSTYNKTDEHEVIYYQGCKIEGNMDVIEKMVLNKLDKYREVENRDRFILPEDKEINFFIDVIKKNIEFILENEN